MPLSGTRPLGRDGGIVAAQAEGAARISDARACARRVGSFKEEAQESRHLGADARQSVSLAYGMQTSAHDAELGLFALGGGAVAADEFDGDAVFVMAHDAAGHLPDQHRLAHRRTRLGLERDAAQRQVENLAGDNVAIGAGEARQSLGRLALVAAQRRFVDDSAVHVERELFGHPLALERRAGELDPEFTLTRARHDAFEAAEAVDVEDDLRLSCGNERACRLRPARRKIGDLALRFALLGGHEQPAGQSDAHAQVPAPFGSRLGNHALAVCCHGKYLTGYGPVPKLLPRLLLYSREGQHKVTAAGPYLAFFAHFTTGLNLGCRARYRNGAICRSPCICHPAGDPRNGVCIATEFAPDPARAGPGDDAGGLRRHVDLRRA